MTIPVMKPWFGPEEAEAAAEAVASGWVAQGPRVAAFEKAFAALMGGGEAVAVSSCTTGLHLALHLHGVGPGDEVVVPSLSFIATANAVRYTGATPVFADVDPATLNVTAETVARVQTRRTRLVLVVHQAGTPADLGPIHKLAAAEGWSVVEDAACAIGARVGGQLVGTGSELAAFSFHPRKLVTTGEGGMLLTSQEQWAARARRLREHGMSVSASERHAGTAPVLEGYLEVGFNYRMTDVQAAIGLVQLGRLDAMVARRRELAERYQRLLADVAGLTMAADPPYGTSNFQSFWVCLPEDFPVDRDRLLALMLAEGIAARRGIMAAHLEPAYAGHPHDALPATEAMTRRSLVLPLFHELTHSEQDHVVAVLRRAAGLER